MIELRSEIAGTGVDMGRLRRDARKLLRVLELDGATLSVLLVGDARMCELNGEHRGKNAATDVLSFPMSPPARLEPSGPERMLGDVVISVQTAARQAAEYDAPLQNEVNRLLIHGILHVLGHDHQRTGERARMQTQERRLAAALGMPWPYERDA